MYHCTFNKFVNSFNATTETAYLKTMLPSFIMLSVKWNLPSLSCFESNYLWGYNDENCGLPWKNSRKRISLLFV